METVPNENDEKFLKYWETVQENPSDFTSWTCLLQIVDQQNLLEKGRQTYEKFFKFYPFCYGYWKKYADLEKKNGNIELAKMVFQSGIKAIPLSVDLWIHYLNFMSQATKGEPDSPVVMRKLFSEAIEAAGLEFRSDKLYDSYIDWEKSQGNLRNVTLIYDRLLATPTQNYIRNFSKFKEHVNGNKPCDILAPDEYLKFLGQLESIPPGVSASDDNEAIIPTTAPPGVDDDAQTESIVPPGVFENDDADSKNFDKYAMDEDESLVEKRENEEAEAIRQKIIASRDEIFKKNEDEVKKRWNFEDAIKRPYFHVKPLEKIQLRNWREYLDFKINEGNHKDICILFERCLIACAMYEEFWQKYISYLETQIGNEVEINTIRDIYERACKTHLTKKPGIIMNWAGFEEKYKNVEKARTILKSLDESMPGMVMLKVRRAGLERRNRDAAKAVEMLKEEIENTPSVDEKSFFAIKCSKILSRFLCDQDSAEEIIYKALENDKGNKKLYLHLLDMELNRNEFKEERLEKLSQLVQECDELSTEFKQGFFQRKLEILEDFGSDINSITKSYDDYQKTYKVKAGAIVAKKRTLEDSDSDLKAKVPKDEEVQSQSNHVDMNSYYANAAYTSTAAETSSVAMQATSAYGYTQAMANPWASYATMPTAGAYYGWYNPYGAYPQQPTQ